MKVFPTKNTVILGNCLQLEEQFLPGSFDMVLTSPPYFNQKECATSGTSSEGEYKNIDEYFKDMERIFMMLAHLSKPGAIFAINIGADPTYDLRAWMSLMLQRIGLKYIDGLAWVKGSGNMTRRFHIEAKNKYYPQIVWEPIYIYQMPRTTNRFMDDKGFPTFEERFTNLASQILGTNVWNIPQDNEAPWHPAPYPRKLAYNLIALYTEPRAVICDPFAGAMTTAVATQDVGGDRIYICCELIEERYEKGLKRIDSNDQQGFGF